MHQKIEEKMIDYLENLAQCGRTANDGVTRRLYDVFWCDAQQMLTTLCKNAGLDVCHDKVGNLFGRRQGSNPLAKSILSGSHLDTVIDGGKLDGIYGVISALIAIEMLYLEYGQPDKTIELIAFAEEESSRFDYGFWGSKSFLELADLREVSALVDDEGISFLEAMEFALKGLDDIGNRSYKEYAAFIEVHIEQGQILEKSQKRIGVVEQIVGLVCYEFLLKGVSNHAGTTRMDERADAMLTYAEIVVSVTAYAKKEGFVLTFGKIKCTPNSSNIIAGEVFATIDMRAPNTQKLAEYAQHVEKIIYTLSKNNNTTATIHKWLNQAAQKFDTTLIETLTLICEKKQIPYKKMPSSAGHDSQIIAPYIPTAMIFVPSIKGISHSPKEATHIKDLVVGVEVLMELLYELAYK
ncbi:allantoate amidohydrolase [Erysipelotrichaceae bacterium]|nr:allantoate amidohydrolase [Erysipelotrichaceae bacterium]